MAIEPTFCDLIGKEEIAADLVVMYVLLTNGVLVDALDRAGAGTPGAAQWAAVRAANLAGQVDAIVSADDRSRETLWYAFMSVTGQLMTWARRSARSHDRASWAAASAEFAPTFSVNPQTVDLLLAWVDGELAGSSCLLAPDADTFGAMVALNTAAMYYLEDGLTDTWRCTIDAALNGIEAGWPAWGDNEWLGLLPRPAHPRATA